MNRHPLQRLAGALVLAGLTALAAGAHAAPIKDSLVLLVPDNADLASWQVKVWTDTAQEEGYRLQTMTDAQFLALGTTSAANIAGLVVPDSAHIQASDAVVAAVKQYANLGGKLMLVYDAGALTDNAVYAPVKSRFSDLVGVDYVMYEALRDRVVGFGPVVGTRARLDSLSLPPGKYAPWGAVTSVAGTAAAATFVPASPADAGGTRHMRPAIEARAMRGVDEGSANVRRLRDQTVRNLLGLNSNPLAVTGTPVTITAKVPTASPATKQLFSDVVANYSTLLKTVLQGSSTVNISGTTTAADTQLNAISGYGYGTIDYFSYVTQGSFPGNVYLSSPDHGLVAGVRPTGSGKVMFVNLPLGYFKAIGTDSAPLHGFMNLFATEHVGLPKMSMQPRGKGGLIYNWHVDDGDDLLSDVKYLLDSTSVLKRGPFSIHFTAGHDVVTLGDNNGMFLDTNTKSQDLVRRLGNLGAWAGKLPVQHELGSHGGWNHDLYGLGANETNQATYQPWLELNFAAIERTTGKKIREYSAPVGNNPTWAVNWLENRGVNSMYFVGDTGAPGVRSWRAGNRLSKALWSYPIVPLGKYATFEEFDLFGVPDTTSGQWLIDLQDFVINHRTNRMFYNHPPGARGHLPALQPMLARADLLQLFGQFRWYTMGQLAAFSQQRLATIWSATTASGLTTFTASHPSSLKDQTWVLPRSKFGTPFVQSGNASVSADNNEWIIAANGGTQLRFVAAPR
ncbi:hypothetical protein [uncultured Sphaerotilus sp.]|uniref:hypothetical protein n=1 Tax=uncultured Sphaerotilus sp. TaxID=474984 RepID=UPI0030CA31BA